MDAPSLIVQLKRMGFGLEVRDGQAIVVAPGKDDGPTLADLQQAVNEHQGDLLKLLVHQPRDVEHPHPNSALGYAKAELAKAETSLGEVAQSYEKLKSELDSLNLAVKSVTWQTDPGGLEPVLTRREALRMVFEFANREYQDRSARAQNARGSAESMLTAIAQIEQRLAQLPAHEISVRHNLEDKLDSYLHGRD